MKLNMSKTAFAMLLASFSIASNAAQSKKLDTAQIDELTGLKGKLNEQEGVYKVSSPRTDIKVSVEGVYKVSSPRTDIKVSVNQWQMPPFMGLTSWAAFLPGVKGEA